MGLRVPLEPHHQGVGVHDACGAKVCGGREKRRGRGVCGCVQELWKGVCKKSEKERMCGAENVKICVSDVR